MRMQVSRLEVTVTLKEKVKQVPELCTCYYLEARRKCPYHNSEGFCVYRFR